MVIETRSPEETFALGEKLGREAKPGQIYTLNGDLGTGKTVFTQGFAAGLGITEPVNSPTFTILQVYEEGRMPFIFDVYRHRAMWRRWTRSAMRTAFTARRLPLEWAELIEESCRKRSSL